ncbi:hypothetical protein B8W72_27205 [Pseudomonas putida]|uniref:Uncharacterized protein n=1 Tax=Pseudomonas putida TaxID=303 RepID=A0A1Y3KLL5_PSEPU|nr:hypothetical protein B8W72_27205 [Pseudomonas putida]
MQPFRGTRPLLQGLHAPCRSGLVPRKGRKAAPAISAPDAPILCPMHLAKAQIPSKPGLIPLKAQYSRALQNWHAPCNS